MSDLDGLAGAAGPAVPAEPVPPRVRILASQESLGALTSAHRPTSRLARIQFGDTRIFVFSGGLVISRKGGELMFLFAAGRMRAERKRAMFTLLGDDGGAAVAPKQWSDPEMLAKALDGFAAAEPSS